MAAVSSWLKHLPPVLWEADPPPPAFSLGTFLQIFEKVLTGIDDACVIEHPVRNGVAETRHAHLPITTEIERIHRLFDPLRTPERFLPWLASWLALDFPTLHGRPLWDEHQRRKVASEITRIHRLRGRKAGLARYLELYAIGAIRPRVTLDDGSRVLTVIPRPTGPAPVTALVNHGPVVIGDTVDVRGLVRPHCVAVASDGWCFLGDIGDPTANPADQLFPSQVWRMSRTGRCELLGAPPSRRKVAAVAVRPDVAGRPDTLYVLDEGGELYRVRAPYVNWKKLVDLAAEEPTCRPVAMCVDGAGDLLVVDRAGEPGSAAVPRLITFRPESLAKTTTQLSRVVEPMSMLAHPDGSLIIGDGRQQHPSAGQQSAGNLVRMTRRSSGSWAEEDLLPQRNHLVAPTGLAVIGSNLYVLDAGLKPLTPPPSPFLLQVADPSMVYRVDLNPGPTITTVAEPNRFVYPLGMAADGGQLIICDRGSPARSRAARLHPFRLEVVMHFSEARLSSDHGIRKEQVRRTVGSVGAIVEQQKPAHVFFDLVTRVQ